MRRYIIPKHKVDAIEVGPDGKPVDQPKRQEPNKRQFDGRTRKGKHGKNHRSN